MLQGSVHVQELENVVSEFNLGSAHHEMVHYEFPVPLSRDILSRPIRKLSLSLSCTVSHILFFFALHPGCRLWGKRSHGTQRDRGGGRRTLSFMNWPRCCRCQVPSPASWTRLPSSGSPSATWRWGTSPTRGTRRGTCAWRDHHPTPQSKVGWSCKLWCLCDSGR